MGCNSVANPLRQRRDGVFAVDPAAMNVLSGGINIEVRDVRKVDGQSVDVVFAIVIKNRINRSNLFINGNDRFSDKFMAGFLRHVYVSFCWGDNDTSEHRWSTRETPLCVFRGVRQPCGLLQSS